MDTVFMFVFQYDILLQDDTNHVTEEEEVENVCKIMQLELG
jgi:hypothetical protein